MNASSLPRIGRRVLVVLAVVVGLLATLVTQAGVASASTRHHSHHIAGRSHHERAMAHSVLHLLNHERHLHHLKPLHMRIKLERSANHHNRAMAHFNVMSHELPREPDIGARVDHQGYHWSDVSENIAWSGRMNTHGVRAAQRHMYNEHGRNDGHRRNILSRDFRAVGIDVAVDHLHHKVWLTADFGCKH